ncbi:uncharacterized [Tachysurus ichikawai]
MTAEETPYPLSSLSSFFTLLPPAMVTVPYLGLTAHSCQISFRMLGVFLLLSSQFLPVMVDGRLYGWAENKAHVPPQGGS